MTDLIPAWQDGRLIPMEKLAVHRLGLRHPAISVFILRGEETLLQQRAFGKYHTPGLWANSCCTHPHWQEPPETCATRRLREELGISGLALHHRGVIEYRADVGSGLTEHELVTVFTAEAPPDMPLSPDPAEVAATHWVPLKDLEREIEAQPDRFTPWLRIYLAEHRGMILGQG